MTDFELSIFTNEVFRQCEYTLIAANRINETLSNFRNQSNIQYVFWYDIQNFLVSAANVSKLLWGSKKTIPESRSQLREHIGVDEDSILKSRTIRNHFEHFDERIETWSSSSERSIFIDSNIGPTNMISGFNKNDYLRNFDTTTLSITFKGDTFELQPIMNAIKSIRESIISKGYS